MKPTDRPEFIRNVAKLEHVERAPYKGSDETFGALTRIAKPLGLKRIAVNLLELAPGRRSSWPHAESLEDEFCYILEGHPHAWIDGHLHPLKPGDAVAFLPGTGIAHTIINASAHPVKFLAVGDQDLKENQIHYPLHPARNEYMAEYHWRDCPKRALGPHDGTPHSDVGVSTQRRQFIRTLADLAREEEAFYQKSNEPDRDERFSHSVRLASTLGLKRIAANHVILAPGRRTSWPHAESLEEEFLFVIQGHPTVWLDGQLHPLKPGDSVAFVPGTGITHTVMNDTNEPVELFVAGNQHLAENKVFYPLHPRATAELGEVEWKNPPRHGLGSHDGRPSKSKP